MLTIQPLINLPEIQRGDDLDCIIEQSLVENGITLQSGDILVITQKIVSKAENQFVDLNGVVPSSQALALAEEVGKDPRLVQVILNESKEIVRKRPGVLIAEHRLGFICANAGVDHSNIQSGPDQDLVLCLPKDPDESARRIQEHFTHAQHQAIGILIIDSHGRAWRNGTVGISIGTCGVPMLVSKIGDTDLYGRELKATLIAAADQLAAAAALVMGEANEGTPVVHVRGFPYSLNTQASLADVIREKEKDMFR